MNLTLSATNSQPICPRHQIHLIHLLDTPFAGQNPIGIALTYIFQSKPATMLVRPSAFRQVIQTLPPGAQQVRVSLNTFQFEFHVDNIVDLNGWMVRLNPPQSLPLNELAERIQERLEPLGLPFTHYCNTDSELDLIWLILPVPTPGPELIAQCREAYALCLKELNDLHPLMENPLVATLPLDACACQVEELGQQQPGAA
ncbi:MAG: hypothetical protein ACAI44_28580 [Candidatus Sericytochromatia bacterium]